LTALPELIDRAEIQNRLRLIFPEGTPNRGYCTRELAASTVFTMLYIGAVEGAGIYLAPKHVYRMSDRQASRTDAPERQRYGAEAWKAGRRSIGRPWYADTTREPIRDETLREGLGNLGAVIVMPGLATTSSRPRYALTRGFADLFDPAVSGPRLLRAIRAWQEAHLSRAALARIQLARAGAAPTGEGVLITFPNGETRRLTAGPSTLIAKAVIEEFAHRFLERPVVLWLSESAHGVVARDEALARKIGLDIQRERLLPDIILVDVGPQQPVIVFAEVVATAGAITPSRQSALSELATGVFRDRIAFVTAYNDRAASPFRKTISELAWNSFAWFVSEPDAIIVLRDGTTAPTKLAHLLDRG
jgi:hypothetical protein